MYDLDRTWNVSIDSVHRAHFLHSVFIAHEFIWDRNAEFQHFQLRVTSLFDVAVHVDFVVKGLVMFDDETLEGGVFVALELVE